MSFFCVPHRDSAALRQPCDIRARPPVAAACGCPDRSSPSFPRRSGGCAVSGSRHPPFPIPVVVLLIQGHVLQLLVELGPLDHDTLDRSCRSLPFQHVRPAITTPAVHRRHRSPCSFWCPFLAVGGILAVFFPKAGLASIASAGCHYMHPPVRHTRRPSRPDSLEDPVRPRRSNESWTVLLVRTAGQLVPLAAAAQPEDDRIQHFPPIGDLLHHRFLGQNSRGSAEYRRHNLSEISQIVPSGLRRGFRRTMAESPVELCRKWSPLATSSFLQKVFRRFSDSYLTEREQGGDCERGGDRNLDMGSLSGLLGEGPWVIPPLQSPSRSTNCWRGGAKRNSNEKQALKKAEQGKAQRPSSGRGYQSGRRRTMLPTLTLLLTPPARSAFGSPLWRSPPPARDRRLQHPRDHRIGGGRSPWHDGS